MVHTSVLRPSIAAAKDYCPFYDCKQTVALWLRYRRQSVFCACGRRGPNNISGGAVGINLNEAPHVNKESTTLCVFMLFFTGIIHLLVEETNRYYHQ
jgi:hypothetical protein